MNIKGKNRETLGRSSIPSEYIPQPEQELSIPKRIGLLTSRLPQSVEISYDGQALKIAPRGRTKKDIEYNKLGTLPAGVQFIG